MDQDSLHADAVVEASHSTHCRYISPCCPRTSKYGATPGAHQIHPEIVIPEVSGIFPIQLCLLTDNAMARICLDGQIFYAPVAVGPKPASRELPSRNPDPRQPGALRTIQPSSLAVSLTIASPTSFFASC